MSLTFSKLGARQVESDIARLMTMALERPELLSLAAGFTDTETLPLEEIAEAAAALGQEGDRTILQYGSNQGRLSLRQRLTARLAQQDGVAMSRSAYRLQRSFISNGSQQALYLAAQTLCDPGDIVLVEQPTYFVFLEMLRGLGVKAVSMPMLASGDVDAAGLDSQLRDYEKSGQLDRVKAVYLVSYYANPSGHSLSRSCKKAVVDLLGGYDGRIALFEDAAYRELYYERPFEAESCVALSQEGQRVPVFYTSTLTKPYASGLKVGYGYCTHDDWLGRMLSVKGQQDFGTPHFNQALFDRVLETGAFDRHLERIRKSYFQKMDTLDQALRREPDLADWQWERPLGGLYLWVQAPGGASTDFESIFYANAIEAGVMYVPGHLCHAERAARDQARLSFGVLDPPDLQEAAKRFARAAKHGA